MPTRARRLWKVKQGDYDDGQTITAAPLVIKDKVITGISGGEFGVRGFLTANDVKTGKQVWRMYSTGPEAEVGFPGSEETWKGDEWKRGGGTTWGWYSYDPELNLLYYGTGNPGSWNPDQRPGDNKWSMTIFARNPDTGKAKWAYQKTPHDAWDYDGINENVLVDTNVRGQMRKVLVNFDRNGFAYMLDRATGELLMAEPFVIVNWATGVDLKTGKPIENPEKRTSSTKNVKDICPSAMGGKNQQPVAYSPKTNLFYVPTNNLCMDYEGVQVKYQAGQPLRRRDRREPRGPGGNRGEFIAWDPTTGKKVWGIKEGLAAWGGALATAGDVVFYGTMEGWLKAVNAKTGELLVEVQDAVRHHRQPDDLRRARREAVRRGALGHRRMVGHRRRRGARRRRSDRRAGRAGRLWRRRQLQQPGRCADGVLASVADNVIRTIPRATRSTQSAFDVCTTATVSPLHCSAAPRGVSATAQAKSQFRVCADPENLPFSNRQLEGFENKIADVMAKELGATLSYIWWGQRRGFIRNTMNATLKEGRCDVMISVPEGALIRPHHDALLPVHLRVPCIEGQGRAAQVSSTIRF